MLRQRVLIAARPSRAIFTAWFLSIICQVVQATDLTTAVVVTPPGLHGPPEKAVRLLVEEIEQRSGLKLTVEHAWPAAPRPVIAVGQQDELAKAVGAHVAAFFKRDRSQPAEGYRISSSIEGGPPVVSVIGNDARGVLFGVGHLLRKLRVTQGHLELADAFQVETSPKYPLRGHQLGYRPKTNSYDAWDLPQWEQYYRDLIVFGNNAVELVPPRTDDAKTSPHFPRPQLEMMTGMSQLADDYGLDVWIWYPALDRDYANPKTVAAALDEWDLVYKALPRIDVVFVPGGDPGHTRPKELLALLEKQTERLHKTHPTAQMWVSPQSFNETWFAEFITILKVQQPAWLGGVVFGPQVRVALPRLRELVPERYPIRHYPDITHSRQCQYPVPNWDVAHAVTSSRECINPRPRDERQIFRLLQPYTIGFLTYSEGCNDDVNKFVWSGLGWNPDADVIDILRDYSGYFIGETFRDSFAQGLLALEQNWRGPLLTNQHVDTTLAQFQDLERQASADTLKNWRFQQALYRAYYDAYVRERLIHETALETAATEVLREAAPGQTLAAMEQAEEILARTETQPVGTDLKQRVFELAEDLFQSIQMQTSVKKYQAIDVDRGATLDTIDYPLNSRGWLLGHFKRIRAEADEAKRAEALTELVRWTDPGPGGFYDDLGNTAAQPHVVPGLPYDQDPAFLQSARSGVAEAEDFPSAQSIPWRKSWTDHAESLLEAPLKLRYAGLDPAAEYKLRVVYAGDGLEKKIRLVANETIEIHPLIAKPVPVKPLVFDVPVAATQTGELNLSWYRVTGLGDNGRGCQVSEVWLIKK